MAESLRRQAEEKNRRMLRAEYWMVISAVLAAVAVAIVVSCIEMSARLRIILIALAVVLVLTVALIGVRIEQKAGYYECRHCRHRYVPTYKQVILAMHAGRTRYMKCPACGKRGWQKKVLTKEA